EILNIGPKIPGKEFDEPPSEEEALSFILELSHSREIKIKIPVLNQSSTEYYKEEEEEEKEKIDDEEKIDKEEDDEVTKELYKDMNVNL
nr:hypothetical protein [Tanacetum cinerariifolium]